MARNPGKLDNGYHFDFDDDETGILTEQSDLLLSDDGIVYDSEMMQLFKNIQNANGIKDLDHDGSFTQSQDSHPPDDYSLDLTDDLEDELTSVSVDGGPNHFDGLPGGRHADLDEYEDSTTPVPPPSDGDLQSHTTSLSEFQALEQAMRRASIDEKNRQEPAEDEARLDEFLRDAEKSHVDYSQMLQSQRTVTPTSDMVGKLPIVTAPYDPRHHRDSADFEVADISGGQWRPRAPSSSAERHLPSRPSRHEKELEIGDEEEELELINVHKRLDEADVDPITLYDQLRHQMDANFEEEKRRSATPKKKGLTPPKVGQRPSASPKQPLKPEERPISRPDSSESNVSVDTVKRAKEKEKRMQSPKRETNVFRPRTSPADEKRSSRAGSRNSSKEQRSRPASEVEQWLMEQNELAPSLPAIPRSRKVSEGSEHNSYSSSRSHGSGIGPLRPSHRLDFGAKQDSVSSCDSDDLGSLSLSGRSESKTALKQKLRQEIGKVKQQENQIEVLKSKYGQLLTKHALAEVTIDQLRVNAKVNLDYQTSHSMSDLRSSAVPSSGMGHRAQSVMEKPTQTQATVPEEVHSLPPSPLTGRISADEPSVTAPRPTSPPRQGSLHYLAGQLSRRLDAFSGLVSEENLPVPDQEEMVRSLRDEYENLNSAYQAAQLRGDGFDAERVFEGELFQLGMRLDDLSERVETNVRWAKRRTPFSTNQRMSRSEEVTTATSATPSTHDHRSPANVGGGLSSGHSTGMSTIRRDGLEEGPNAELGDRLTDLEDQYLRLMTRYNELKGKMTTDERDKELESLMKELTTISEEAAGLSQVISTPEELAEQFRFDREASILDQELEQAAQEEQQQQEQQQQQQHVGRHRRSDRLDGRTEGTPPSRQSTVSRQSLSRQGSQSSAGLGLRSEDLEWSSTATTAVQRRGSRSGYTTGTTGGAISDLSGTSSRPATGRRRTAQRQQYNPSLGSRSSIGDSGVSTPVGSPIRDGSRRTAGRTGGRSHFANEVDGNEPERRGLKLRLSRDSGRPSGQSLEWSAGEAVTGPSDISTASTVTRIRRQTRRANSVGDRREGGSHPRRKQSQESRPISATSMESGQSTRLRSLEQDVHWLKEQLTGSQLSLEESTHSGFNLDRYDPDSSLAGLSTTPDPGKLEKSRRRRSRSVPSPEGGRGGRIGGEASAERKGVKDRGQRPRRKFLEELEARDITTDELLTTEEDEEVFDDKGGMFKRRYEPRASGPPILKPLSAGHDGVTAPRKPRGRKPKRNKRGKGADLDEDEEELPYDPYQRYMSEPFALRRERHGMQSDEEETSSGEEDWRPRRRRNGGSHGYSVPPAPGRGILRPPGHSPMFDDFPLSRRRSRSRSPDSRGSVRGPLYNSRTPAMPGCPLCGSMGLHSHPSEETQSNYRYPKNGPVKAFWLPLYSRRGDEEPVYPLREYITHGAVRYYVREYTNGAASPNAMYPPSRNLMRSFQEIADYSNEDREVRAITRHRLNESLSDAIRAARTMSRVASKVREGLRSEVSKTVQRRRTPLSIY